jgi:hypothetical protein
MENRQKVICIKKCVSDTYQIANIGDILYIDKSVGEIKQLKTEIQLMKAFNFSYGDINRLFGIETEKKPLYPKYNLFILDRYNIKMSCGEFDARNFMTQAEYRDSRIDDIFTDDCVESKICKLLN